MLMLIKSIQDMTKKKNKRKKYVRDECHVVHCSLFIMNCLLPLTTFYISFPHTLAPSLNNRKRSSEQAKKKLKVAKIFRSPCFRFSSDIEKLNGATSKTSTTYEKKQKKKCYEGLEQSEFRIRNLWKKRNKSLCKAWLLWRFNSRCKQTLNSNMIE